MGNKNDTKVSKVMSLVLRHQPESIGVRIDGEGWCNIEELIIGINKKGYKINRDDIERIVKEDNKQRYSFNEDKSKIRANQGHSIPVDLGLKEVKPPDVLYHGTAEHVLAKILASGIKKQSRQYVHLSKDEETALVVGKRHGKPVILKIDSKMMYEDGIMFFISENGIWLTDFVDKKYITLNN